MKSIKDAAHQYIEERGGTIICNCSDKIAMARRINVPISVVVKLLDGFRAEGRTQSFFWKGNVLIILAKERAPRGLQPSVLEESEKNA